MRIEARNLARYMAIRLRNWLVAFVAVVIIIGLISVAANCQDHLTLHTDQDEWEDTIGVKFVTVTSRTEDTLYYYVTRKWEQRLSSIAWDKRTIWNTSKDKKKKLVYEGCFMMIYCKKHLMAYVLNQIKCFDGGV